ncbi:MAG: glycogen-binding domain-containing protein [Candidatus Latescibacterota bacterium]
MLQKSKKRVYFRYQAPNAKVVSVLGSFNGWEERPMKKNKEGEWSTWTLLEAGRYEYRFKIDGLWQNAPDAETVPNEHGSENNVLKV